MDAPPPFVPQKPRSKVGLIVGIVVAVLAICCGLPSIGLFMVGKKGLGFVECAIAFEGAREAAKAYAADHHGNLPPADNWQEAIKPYFVKNLPSKEESGPIGMPNIDEPLGCKGEASATGMAYNTALAAKNLDKIESKYTSVIFFEVSTPKKNLAQEYKEQDSLTSPTMFGRKRGWFTISIEGPLLMNKDGRSVPFNVNTSRSGFNVETKQKWPASEDSK